MSIVVSCQGPRTVRIAAALLFLAAAPVLAGAARGAEDLRLRINSRASLLHLGSIDSFDKTEGGIRAAHSLLHGLEDRRPDGFRAAIGIYEQLIPKENFGGEYTALQWFCEYLLASKAEQAKMLEDPFVAAYFHFFADNDFATLREYLKRKYGLAKFPDQDNTKGHRRLGFLEDFILFNNPRREQWEQSSRMIEVLGLTPGQVVADVGCGPGYFTFQFARLVGPQGRVYAIDTNDLHTEYVSGLAKKFGVANVQTVEGRFNDIRLNAQVDCAFMCSLYHIIYASSPERDKDALIRSIRKVLKPDGTFVVVDNALVEDQKLPYHGPYMAKELIIGQLRHLGFRLVAAHQFIPQRYILVFKPAPIPPAGDAPLAGTSQCVEFTSKTSLIHIPNEAIPDTTEGSRQAAKWFLAALEKGDRQAAAEAVRRYAELIPKEKFGDEYTAFQWFGEYLLAPEAEQKRLRQQKYQAEYFQYLAADNFATLREYVNNRYQPGKRLEDMTPPGSDDTNLRPHINQDQRSFWRDFILFNTPTRPQWEKTDRIVEFLKLQPGQSVADLGCGPGYYTFKFAELVGRTGRVFAVDTNRQHLDYVVALAKKYAQNVEPVAGRLNDACLAPQSVDMIFMCSLYGVIYTTSMEMVKDQFIESLKKALKPRGRLVIVDNAVVRDGELPYHGPYIAKEFVIGQLEHYGFRLVDSAQFIPQRYVLVFEMR